MKKFHYKLGHIAGSTMTVSELIETLQQYPADMPVFGTWEGVNGYIMPGSFSVEAADKGNYFETCECLLIDVEGY